MPKPNVAQVPGPLAGVRVIDAATERAELAGRILADLGADVLKVEPPEGAAARRLPPFERGRETDADGSLYWAAVGLGKRSCVIDLGADEGRRELRALLCDADVFVESWDPGEAERRGVGFDAVRAENPGLIYVSITPFGRDGPHAHTPATELTLEAAGGLLGLQGDGDRPPIPVGFPQAAFHAGAQAAADAVIALHERERSGLGQHLDVSIQAAMVWTLMNATGYPSVTGHDPPGTGEERADAPPGIAPGLVLPRLLACAEGWAVTALGLPRVGEATTHVLMQLADAAGHVPEELRGGDWSRWVRGIRSGEIPIERMNRAFESIRAYVRTLSRARVMELAVEHRVLLAPVYDVRDLRSDVQLAARDYWTRVGDRDHPGAFARLSETPISLSKPAPRLGERGRDPAGGRRMATRVRCAAGEGAFAGLKVADFAWVGVGPMISKALADHGATVVHVESERRIDVLRNLPPFKDDERGVGRSQFHANFNTSKLGLALDLSNPAGRGVARRLVAWADVVVESFTPGTLRKLDLDWETLRRDRPDLVMLGTCMRGQTGPEATYGGFGNQGAALAGLFGITGWPDRPPSGPWGAYTDFIAPRYGVTALAAALVHRARTGRGQYVDLSQIEAAIHFLEPLALDYTVNGRVADAVGHACDRACPHGVYRCVGKERYVAIAVETAAQWRALAAIAPLAGLGGEAAAARNRDEDAIDTRLSEWTRDREAFGLAGQLQRCGVPAYVVQRPSDLFADAQLCHRGFFVELDHAEMGPTAYDGLVTRFSRTPGDLRRPGPLVGEHTRHVLADLLAMSETEIEACARAGALT